MSDLTARQAAAGTLAIRELAPITTSARPLNQHLWTLLTKPEPLTAEEWAFVDEQERVGQLN